jgi:hypothetical protein
MLTKPYVKLQYIQKIAKKVNKINKMHKNNYIILVNIKKELYINSFASRKMTLSKVSLLRFIKKQLKNRILCNTIR